MSAGADEALWYLMRGSGVVSLLLLTGVMALGIATFGGVQNFSATAYIFQMKNRFAEDWRDTVKQEITGADGGPIQQQHSGKVAINLKNLTDEELDALEATLSKAVEGDAA